MTASHSSSEVLASMRSRRKPALLTSTSSRPNVSMAVATRPSAWPQSATSAPLATASPPMARIASTTSPAGPVDPPWPSLSAPRSLTTTLAPWRANSSAWARPIPRPEPVTMTTRPSQMPMPGIIARRPDGSSKTVPFLSRQRREQRRSKDRFDGGTDDGKPRPMPEPTRSPQPPAGAHQPPAEAAPTLRVPRPDEATPADEMTMARAWLTHLRESAVLKLEDLDDDQLRWAPAPPANSLGVIGTHLGYAERFWFRAIFAGEEMDMTWRQHMFELPDGWSVDDVVAFYRAEC